MSDECEVEAPFELEYLELCAPIWIHTLLMQTPVRERLCLSIEELDWLTGGDSEASDASSFELRGRPQTYRRIVVVRPTTVIEL